jgi:hypothetical protein
MPEQHGQHTAHAQDQRQAQEKPFLSQEIDIWITE